jgi:hypothetical protein
MKKQLYLVLTIDNYVINRVLKRKIGKKWGCGWKIRPRMIPFTTLVINQ